jgi:ATP-dependent Clp protease ATP-binding subunit ClpC
MDWHSVRQSFELSIQHFTDRSVKVLSVARKNAKDYNHTAITPEHVLLALAEVEPGPGRIVLDRLGIHLEQLLAELEALASIPPEQPAKEKVSFDPATESVLQQSKKQSKSLHHNYVGTEHLVLGLLASNTTEAAKFLLSRGATLESFREETIRFLTMD